ncbi:hypothetical protein SS50377_25492 [Spironucleus salmonicida]|uniref:KATNIP domain-containing protein n=1 Tax=Spironucleus salmonicida TaxID=348837 RepID=V6LW48_9EUKA|nr:hypothetical protein SS50377_25492 [Spironucleus salmonicida]|eukprot:EST45039.1 hypothetical protein SS50377_15058 [Spironucleus salmonicida]
MSDPEELKPMAYQQQTPSTKSRALVQHQQYLQKLSEKSRALKQQREAEEQTKEKQLEKQFSVYNSGANRKLIDKEQKVKNIKKWDETANLNTAIQPVYAVQQNISPTVQNQYGQENYEDTLIDLANQYKIQDQQTGIGTLKQQEIYSDQNNQNNYQDQSFIDQKTLNQHQFQPDKDQNQPDQHYQQVNDQTLAPKASLFTLDNLGNEISLEQAMHNPPNAFAPMQQPEEQKSHFDANLDDTEFGITKEINESDDNLAQTGDLNAFPDLADDKQKPEDNYAQSFKMLSLANQQDYDYRLSPAQIPETLFMLLNAMDQLPDSNFGGTGEVEPKTQTQMILCDEEEQIEGDYVGECKIENMAEDGQLGVENADKEVILDEKNEIIFQNQGVDIIQEQEDLEGNQTSLQKKQHNLSKIKKLPKPARQNSQATIYQQEADNNLLSLNQHTQNDINRCEQLYESLKGNGIEIISLVQQMQVMSPKEKQEVLFVLKDAQLGEQSGLQSLKVSIDYSKQIQQYQSNLSNHVEEPRRLLSAKRPLSGERVKNRVPSATPKPLLHQGEHQITGLPTQLPKIMKINDQSRNLDDSLKISLSTSQLQTMKSIKQQETLSLLNVIIIEILNVYPIQDAMGTIVPNLLSADKNPVYIVHKSIQDKQEVQKQENQRIIIEQIPQNSNPFFIFTLYNEKMKYVLSQDQRKGRMRVGLPKDFKAKIWQINIPSTKPFEDVILDYCITRRFRYQSSCILECISYLPISLNQITPDNSLVFKKPTISIVSKTPRLGTPKLEKSIRLRKSKDQIEIDILSNYGGNQSGLNSILLFDSQGHQILLPNDDVSISSTDRPEAILNLFLYQNLGNQDSRKQWTTANTVTSSIIITSSQHLRVTAMKILNYNCPKEQTKCTKDIQIKFNNEVVKNSELGQFNNKLDQIDFILLRQDMDLQDILEKLIYQNQDTQQPVTYQTPQLSKQETPLTKKLTPNSLKLQNNGFLVEDYSTFSITLLLLDTFSYNSTGYSIGDIQLQTQNKNFLQVNMVQPSGQDFEFFSRGEKVEQNQTTIIGQNLSQPLLFAQRLNGKQRNTLCKATLWFKHDQTDTITHLMINNFAQSLDNTLRQFLIFVNGVIQQPFPGVILPQCVFSPDMTNEYLQQYTGFSEQGNITQIQQNFIQDVCVYTPILIKQGISKASQELQRHAQQSGNFYEFIQSKFQPVEIRLSRGNNQIQLIHQKINSENLTYITSYQPQGNTLQIDILSYYRETKQVGVSLIQLFQNGKDQINFQKYSAQIYSNLMTSQIFINESTISDSQNPAYELLQNKPWIVIMKNISGQYIQGYSSCASISTLYITFPDKQEISGISLISDNIAEICISFDGKLLFEGLLSDNGNIQQISFSKHKLLGDQLLIQ